MGLDYASLLNYKSLVDKVTIDIMKNGTYIVHTVKESLSRN